MALPETGAGRPGFGPRGLLPSGQRRICGKTPGLIPEPRTGDRMKPSFPEWASDCRTAYKISGLPHREIDIWRNLASHSSLKSPRVMEGLPESLDYFTPLP